MPTISEKICTKWNYANFYKIMNIKWFVPKLHIYKLLFTKFKVNKYALWKRIFLQSPPPLTPGAAAKNFHRYHYYRKTLLGRMIKCTSLEGYSAGVFGSNVGQNIHPLTRLNLSRHPWICPGKFQKVTRSVHNSSESLKIHHPTNILPVDSR